MQIYRKNLNIAKFFSKEKMKKKKFKRVELSEPVQYFTGNSSSNHIMTCKLHHFSPFPPAGIHSLFFIFKIRKVEKKVYFNVLFW